MKLTVKLFAQARQLAGSEEVEIDVPENATADDVLAALIAEAAELSAIEASLLIAVDNQFAEPSTVIPPGATVACFPPVSGG